MGGGTVTFFAGVWRSHDQVPGKAASATSRLGAVLCPGELEVALNPSITLLNVPQGMEQGHRWGRLAGRERTHLHHGDHALVGDRVRADDEVPRGVPADDAVDGVPVWGVGLVSVHHGEVCDHRLHPVFGDLPGILQGEKERSGAPRKRGEVGRFPPDPGGALLLPDPWWAHPTFVVAPPEPCASRSHHLEFSPLRTQC